MTINTGAAQLMAVITHFRGPWRCAQLCGCHDRHVFEGHVLVPSLPGLTLCPSGQTAWPPLSQDRAGPADVHVLGT